MRVPSPVGDFGPDGSSSRPVPCIRRYTHRISPLATVFALHAGIAWAIIASPCADAVLATPESTVPVFLRSRLIVSTDPTALRRRILVPREAPVIVSDRDPDVDRLEVAVIGVGTTPPRPDDGAPDASGYARDAGLPPGNGATVVLRIEVLGTGELGRIEVDVSGGRREIDQAAIAYARAMPWIGGMVDGRRESMWIRWGVRLQA